ncbi:MULTISPECIES: hypothetical protein [Enterococcus]|uniref:Uncharacterized protein n=1 Tax=Enterococcus malodoratus ATCC 43197 TaxID=1158601 RepID=R2QUH5_9ENTE|nr:MULTISPECIES: hypothetical protein [Enterococcus]EOH75170.1 hypothetical protein UAI_02972 [Enterococcus malodoratus ATCC 43197]EOT66632.1 hypothetical protein I585_02153 [Enterococcus malodoratus ATCC 43197]SES75937.1 hypothetical protein SAMN04487821_102181 [Enterococcus malodoratus]SPW90654.1 Uncharacterised protein [Enterococcus malodoratus]STD70115.1 Uncharacterised protein [Enterococcus malodoratus]
MKSKLLLPKVATYLIGCGVILMMLGYALSGFSADRYRTSYDDRHWYNVVGFYIDD